MGTNEKNMTTDAWKYLTAVLYDGRYHDRRTGGRG